MSSCGVGPTNCETTKKEIFTYGSVIADFTIYEDFLTYGSGVYRHVTEAAKVHRAINCIGQGVENGQDYWLCVNSWSNTRGDQGIFKILMYDCAINV
jgi:cathepsin B